jgi:peptidyl-prolyl cis-trans isomerase SurA
MLNLKYLKPICILAPLLLGSPLALSAAENQGVLATVNDKPVTAFDVEQRIKLLRILGDGKSKGELRKRALQSVIDDIIKQDEARKVKAEPTDEAVNKQIERMAKNTNTTVDGLAKKFKSQGVSMNALKRYVASQLAFNRIVASKNPEKVQADQAEVDRRYNEIKAEYNKIVNDPRMKPITVYQLQEISLPVDTLGDANDQQVLMSRALEAQQLMQRYNGCKNARSAAEGIFNVKVGKSFEADSAKLPKDLKKALDGAGAGKAIGPIRGKGGIQVIGFCGKRTIKPQKPQLPPREAVENAVLNEAYNAQEERYMAELRQKAYIEYKGASQPQ